MENKTVIIFDVDGTLVDISKSYKSTDLITSYIYVQKVLGIKDLPALENWFTVDFIDDVKERVGFNNDYTCTATILDFFLQILELQVDNYDEISLKNVSFKILHIKSMSEVKTRWYKYLKEKFSDDEKRPEEILEESKWRILIQNTGSFRDDNYLERIFQEVYYGSKKFLEYFDLEPKFFTSEEGYYKKEKLLIPVAILDQLQSQGVILGICTGRPQEDLNLFLETFSLGNFFKKEFIITLTDIQKEELRLGTNERLSKPHPWPVLELKNRCGLADRIFMIGDSKDDLISASKANIEPVLYSPKAQILDLKIDYNQIQSWDELLEIIETFHK